MAHRYSRTRKGLLLVGAALTLASGLVGCDKEATAPPPAAQARGPVEVSVAELKAQRVSLKTELPGRTTAFLTADVRPQVNGIILKRLFEEGQDVKEGDVLYEIDPASYQAALAQARAQLSRASASLSIAQKRSKRVSTLTEQEVLSAQERDDATTNVSTTRADVAAARAAVENAQLNLDRTKVLAPISGRISRNTVMPGALAVASQTALATITQLDPVYVDITRSSAELLKLRRDLESGKLARADGDSESVKVTLVLEDGTPYPHAGALKFADATVNASTNTVTLRAVVPNPDGLLLPGMYVRAELTEGVANDVILVPQQAVSRNSRGQATVLVVTPENTVELRVTEVSRTIGDQWLVESGLKAGEKVIMEGSQKARPGSPVVAVPYAPKGATPTPGAQAPAKPEAAPAAQAPAKPEAAPAAPADAAK